MEVEYLTKGKKKGVFLLIQDWRSLKKELQKLQHKVDVIEKRRSEILANYNKSKKESRRFSSEISQLKAALR
jgi:peptidoglycan hydrolase CwlO-like protein